MKLTLTGHDRNVIEAALQGYHAILRSSLRTKQYHKKEMTNVFNSWNMFNKISIF